MTSYRRSSARKGFTLVEILIVVIILGILAAIVIPQFTNASTSARQSNLASQDQTIKSQISLYMLQHNDTPPALANLFTDLTSVSDANGNLSGAGGFNAAASFGPYLQATPTNPLTNSTTVVALGTAATTTTGWYYSVGTGEFHGANSTGAQSDTGF
jgi:prepilin-type N-terminal cleavage/methylation domain-containing protein